MMHALDTAQDKDFIIWGDSLGQGTAGLTYPWSARWSNKLGALFTPTRTVDNQGVGGETADQVIARMLAYGTSLPQIQLIWVGRNGVLTTPPSAIVPVIQAGMAAAGHNRQLVFSVPPKTDGTENPGSANGNLVAALNAAYLAAFPNNYFDAAAIIGMDPADRTDGLHLGVRVQDLIALGLRDRVGDEGW